MCSTNNNNIFSYLKKKSTGHSKFFSDDEIYPPPPVRFLSLFRFSTNCERFSIFIGMMFAIIAGSCLPVINLVYGELTNLLINRQFPTEEASEKTFILSLFGGGRILRNASQVERMEALDEDALAFVISVMVFSVGAFVFLGLSVFIFNFTALRQVNRIRMMLFKSILSQGQAWFDKKGHINITSKISEELTQIQNGIGERLSIFIYQMSVAVIIIGMSLYLGWLLTLALLGCLIPMLIIYLVLNQIQSGITANEVVSVEKASEVAEEAIRYIRTVYAYGGEDTEVRRYKHKLMALDHLGTEKGIATGFGVGFVWILIYACYAVAFSFGFRLILWIDEYNPTVLISVFFAVLTAATSLSYSGPFWESFAMARGSAASIYNIINTKSDINPFSEDGITAVSCKGEIEFKNVNFHYSSRPEKKILSGLSFKINAGERIAIIGGSGSGKSTILHLIQRFYDPVVGEICIDGMDLKTLNVSWLRSQMSVILQDPVVFSATVGENIAYGLSEAGIDEIIDAAKNANAHEFITQMPEEYDTFIGRKGGNLSPGQKQRIAVARAIIRKPKIVLLDEATSALDRENESIVLKALLRAFPNITTVIVTHKVYTLENVDRILVLENGVIVEEGTHETLKKQDGFYNRLLKAEIENFKRPTQRRIESDPRNDLPTGLLEESITLLPGARGNYFSDFNLSSAEQIRQSKVKDERYLKVNCFQFLQWNNSHWPFLYIGIIASVFLGCILPVVCVLFGEIVGLLAVMRIEAVYQVDLFSLILLLIGLASGVLGFIQMCFLGVASVRLTTYLRLKTFETILRQEIGWFDTAKNSVAALSARLNTDCSVVPGVISSRVGIIVQGLTAMLLGTGISLFHSWRMTLVSLLVVPIIFSGVIVDLIASNRQKRKELESLENATELAGEVIQNIKVVKSLGKESAFLTQYVAYLKAQKNCIIPFLRGIAYSLSQTVVFFGYALALWYGAYLMKVENLHYKEVIMVSELVIYGCWMLGQSVAMAPNFKNARDAAGRLQYLFYRVPKIRNGDITHMGYSFEGSDFIDFSNIFFGYPMRPNVLILKNISLTIREGESVALVGPSGSGKSSILQLLLRFYDPYRGTIYLGSKKLISYRLSALRRFIALVAQEPVLFNRTIYENIAYGDNMKDVNLDDVIAAAKAANIHSFISSLPLGYETKVGPQSSHLSGGQRQKIAIARALIRNPKILLLDEATSALDPESERSVQEALNSAMSGRTTITVAHRWGAIANVDTIHVIVDGKIVESGTHSNLMKRKGMYFKMRGGV